jgi:drug/metabolite transporter (DMT)-like permease
MSPTLTSELAGLGTALLWASSAMCWAVLSRRINPTAVSTVRLVFAVAALAAIHCARYDLPWPTGLSSTAFWVLCLSGVVGAGLGDLFYFHSLRRIGPRLTMTICALTPVAAALLALLPPIRERMSGQEVIGMALAIGGVIWVVSEKHGRTAWPSTPASFRQGVILSILSVLCLAVSFISARLGMNAFTAAPVPAFSATLLRVTAACLWTFGLVAVTGQTRETAVAFRHRRDFAWLLLGVTVGPVCGIWMSMVALQGAATGVASTLICLSPLFLIPMSWIAYGERPTVGRIVATIIALGGVACMMLA